MPRLSGKMIQYFQRLVPMASLLTVIACGGEEGTVPGSNNGRFPDFSDVKRTYTCEEFCEGAVRGCARTGQYHGERKLMAEYGWCIKDCKVDALNANLDKPLNAELGFPQEYATVEDLVRCTVDGDCPDIIASSKLMCGA